MGNIDEKRLSALLERINNIKVELEALENEVRGLGAVAEPAEVTAAPTEPELSVVTEPTLLVTEPVEVTTEPTEIPAAEPAEASDIKEDIPIEIDIPDIGIPSIIEDPAAEYHATTPASPVPEPITPVTEPTAPVTEPVVRQSSPTIEVTLETPEPVPYVAEPTPPVTEPVEVTLETSEPTLQVTEPAVQPNSTTSEAAASPTTLDDLPFDDDLPIDDEPAPASKPEPTPKPKTSILDSQKPETAVMDVMAEKQAWRTDRPGSQVKNVISAISLNDRVLLINVLFKEDPLLFQNTISAFNGMTTLDEAISYIQTNFPDWDMNSEPIYRLMMAVRRKLR